MLEAAYRLLRERRLPKRDLCLVINRDPAIHRKRLEDFPIEHLKWHKIRIIGLGRLNPGTGRAKKGCPILSVRLAIAQRMDLTLAKQVFYRRGVPGLLDPGCQWAQSGQFGKKHFRKGPVRERIGKQGDPPLRIENATKFYAGVWFEPVKSVPDDDEIDALVSQGGLLGEAGQDFNRAETRQRSRGNFSHSGIGL